jgi:S1-C subfamily serine protease
VAAEPRIPQVTAGVLWYLRDDTYKIGTGEEAEIRFSAEDLTPGLSDVPGSGFHAVLERRGGTYELRPALQADVWVNGRRTERRLLESGDVLEIGEGGPVLRFRTYPPGSRAYKSVTEVFSDCAECAKHSRSAADRAGLLLAGPPMELLTRTSPAVRVFTVALMIGLVAIVGVLWTRSERLEQELAEEARVIHGLAELLEAAEQESLSDEDVAAIREDLAARIAALEARSGARGRVIAASEKSIVFVQGAWGFNDPDGRPLRYVGLGPDGLPLTGAEGPIVTLEGDGPPVDIRFTGTAFVVNADGHLLTNRHIALPWDFDAPPDLFEDRALEPVMHRLVGYLPGVEEPVDIELVRASKILDVALLLCSPVGEGVLPLPLATDRPRQGDEVIVMGYPMGIQALLARADPEALQTMMADGPLDFWQVTRRLSAAGLIEPLATVGVVGQVTETSVVYDAETTRGGSGGPVLNLDGEVLAVNAAVLPEFGGSNLGVPAAEALRLLQDPHTGAE